MINENLTQSQLDGYYMLMTDAEKYEFEHIGQDTDMAPAGRLSVWADLVGPERAKKVLEA